MTLSVYNRYLLHLHALHQGQSMHSLSDLGEEWRKWRVDDPALRNDKHKSGF